MTNSRYRIVTTLEKDGLEYYKPQKKFKFLWLFDVWYSPITRKGSELSYNTRYSTLEKAETAIDVLRKKDNHKSTVVAYYD